MKLDITKSYAIVAGHASAKFEQDGRLFGPDLMALDVPTTPAEVKEEKKKTQDAALTAAAEPAGKTGEDLNGSLVTDKVESAMTFLRTILAENPVDKKVIFSEAEKNNQNWDDVKNASLKLEVKRTMTKGKPEMWSLPEAKAGV